MNKEHSCKISWKNSKRLLKNLQKTAGDYFFLTHPVVAMNKAFSALTLLVGWQEGHLVCKK